MTESMPPLPSEAAAEDIAEQHRSVVPEESEPEPTTVRPEVDEADAWEQGQEVPADDGEDTPPIG
ncbi:MAG TPA: hypothetical protein VHC49_27230 [Mycobacteriales bacterium]|nr:hypothetical protein [Mycobacteriales bacterium]